MELLNIMDNHVVRLWLTQSAVVFFIIAGITLLVIGVSLIVNSAGTLGFFGRMNRWISLRGVSKPLEIPRDTQQAVQNYRYWFAAVFVLGGIFAVYGLLRHFSTSSVITLFGLGYFRPVLAEWLVESARWVLVAGNLVGIVLGAMLAFSPGAVAALEARGSHWYSERKVTKGADSMNIRLDPWVAAYPRVAGGIIVVLALGLLGAFGLMLPVVW